MYLLAVRLLRKCYSIPNSVTMHCAASWGKWAAWRPEKTRDSKQLEQTTTRDKGSLSFRLNPLFGYLFLEGWNVILLTVYRLFTVAQHLSSSMTPTEYDACSTSHIHPFQPVSHPLRHSRFLSSWSTMAPMVFASM